MDGVYYSELLQIYGGLLTEKHRAVAEAYYSLDLSLAEIAEENGVSLSTAETALDILRSEGYIDSAERSGFFCAYPLIPLGISTSSAFETLCS